LFLKTHGASFCFHRVVVGVAFSSGIASVDDPPKYFSDLLSTPFRPPAFCSVAVTPPRVPLIEDRLLGGHLISGLFHSPRPPFIVVGQGQVVYCFTPGQLFPTISLYLPQFSDHTCGAGLLNFFQTVFLSYPDLPFLALFSFSFLNLAPPLNQEFDERHPNPCSISSA